MGAAADIDGEIGMVLVNGAAAGWSAFALGQLIMHGACDFTSFSVQPAGQTPLLSPVLQFGTYILASIVLEAVLRHERHAAATA